MKTPRICEAEGCERIHSCRGFCKLHYTRWRRHGDALVQKKVHVPKTDGIPHGTSHGYNYYKCRCDKCREFIVNKSREWAQNNPNRIRERRLIRDYGITSADYDRMLTEQDGLCAVCHQPPSEGVRWLHVDHCHDTGKVRGLLCQKCNVALGMLRESPEIVRSLLAYIAEHAEASV